VETAPLKLTLQFFKEFPRDALPPLLQASSKALPHICQPQPALRCTEALLLPNPDATGRPTPTAGQANETLRELAAHDRDRKDI
jgi:hypothetical protein